MKHSVSGIYKILKIFLKESQTKFIKNKWVRSSPRSHVLQAQNLPDQPLPFILCLD